MLTSKMVKDFALNVATVDMVGIANIERFKDAPPDMNPLNVMPRAKSVIVIANRILRGCYRGIDEGTHWPSYSVFGYIRLNCRMSDCAYKISRYIETFGYETGCTGGAASSREIGPRGSSAGPGKPVRDVTVSLRIAATLAGLGEIGWSKVFLTEEFGPRQRLNVILTEAELEPDPIKTGHLCDRCKRCVVECPGCAIPKDQAVGFEVEGHRVEWGDIDIGKCKLTHFGLNRKNGQFLIKRYPGLYMPMADQNVTWKEAWDLGWGVFPTVPYYAAMSSMGAPALCGARGCIIGCMKHMEKRGKVKNKFIAKPVFSDQKPWEFPEKPEAVDHHGFIYDPDEDKERKADAKGATTWY
jgi:epoxyqueuosine reductase